MSSLPLEAQHVVDRGGYRQAHYPSGNDFGWSGGSFVQGHEMLIQYSKPRATTIGLMMMQQVEKTKQNRIIILVTVYAASALFAGIFTQIHKMQ